MNFVNFARAVRSQLRWAIVMIAVTAIVAPEHSAAQIKVDPNTEGNTGGSACSLQEAIYATEFGQAVALDQTAPDDTYYTGCTDPSGAWNVIVLPGGTLNFTKFWDGDAHNPFGPTATPIIFKTITIQGNGTTLQWAWTAASPTTSHFRLFAVGSASITPTSGVLTGGPYQGTGNLTLQDVYVKGFNVKGGDGADGGGGGLGAGGAIYVGALPTGVPSLTVENSTFDSNSAVGGNGGNSRGQLAGGGGGGLGGNGGSAQLSDGGGGGGARGNGGSVNAGGGAGGGGGGTVFSGGDGFCDTNYQCFAGPGGYLWGGDGAGFNGDGNGQPGQGPGGGGGGGVSIFNPVTNITTNGDGGAGAYGGGGGGGAGTGGSGGVGGGGGSIGVNGSCCGGDGGFGGGGGMPSGKGAQFGGNAGDCSANNNCAGGGGGALGGAIFNGSGIVVIRNSTFYQNAVLRGLGGDTGVDNGGDGGGAIFSYHGSLTVQNSTIYGNAASGAGGGLETVLNGTLVLQNTIVANNGAQECITGGLVNTAGSAANLITANSSCPAATVTSDPQLGPLQINSPGDTPTMAIQYGVSPAVDAGDDSVVSANAALQTSQNGLSRPQGAHADIGAYEAPPPTADLSITKSVSSSTAQPGDTLTYTLGVSNAGPNTANNVTVSDTLPTSYVTFVSCTESTGTGTCSVSGGVVTVSYSSLAKNASSTVTINTTVNTGVTDGVSVGNNASVSASDPTDPNTANNTSATVYFTVHNKADLAVTKSVSSTSPYFPATGIEVGDSLTYTVTLTNKGPYDAKSVVLSDSAPAGVTFIGCTASVGTCVWTGSSASLSLSSFTNTSGATLTIQATLNFGVADGSTVTNSASVTSTTNDPDPTNNSGSASFKALNNSDLYVFQSTAKLQNRQLKYTINVKNLGKYIAKQLTLNDMVPSGSKFVSITPGSWTCSALPAGSTGTISCTLATEAVNVTQILTFVVKVTTPGNVLVNNTASVSAATFDPNTANNTSTLGSKVGP